MEKVHTHFLSSYFHRAYLTASNEMRKGGFLFVPIAERRTDKAKHHTLMRNDGVMS